MNIKESTYSSQTIPHIFSIGVRIPKVACLTAWEETGRFILETSKVSCSAPKPSRLRRKRRKYTQRCIFRSPTWSRKRCRKTNSPSLRSKSRNPSKTCLPAPHKHTHSRRISSKARNPRAFTNLTTTPWIGSTQCSTWVILCRALRTKLS